MVLKKVSNNIIEKDLNYSLQYYLKARYYIIMKDPVYAGKCCQAQCQLASPVPVELRLSLSLIITTSTHPPPHTRESRDAA